MSVSVSIMSCEILSEARQKGKRENSERKGRRIRRAVTARSAQMSTILAEVCTRFEPARTARFGTGQARQAEPPREPAQEAVFFAFHFAARGGLPVVEAPQMQQTVDGVADEFRLPACPKAPRLNDRFFHADKNFAVQGGAVWCALMVRIVEGDD